MFVISVIPIGRGITKEELTYFSGEEIDPGSVVTVPIRGKNIPALVVGSENARDQKGLLRASTFSLKKIMYLSAKKLLPAHFIDTAQVLGRYYASSTGAILSGLVPKTVFEAEETIVQTLKKKNSFEVLAIQNEIQERVSFYKALIREQFASNNTVYIVAPTVKAAVFLHTSLSQGIESYSFLAHGSLSKKKFLDVWQKTAKQLHPIVLIGTGSILCFPRNDIGVIIVEDENSSAYKLQTRPFPDIRLAAEFMASRLGIRLILGGLPLRIETVWRLHEGEIREATPMRFRPPTTSAQHIIDMRPYKAESRKPFPIFSNELRDLILRSEKSGGRLLLFVVRKGLAPQTVCGDCGSILLCRNCSAPLVLHGKVSETEPITRTENFFLCHHCGRQEDASIHCRTCNSWKLRPLGIGLERVMETLRTQFPHRKVFSIDRDSKTPAEAEKTVAEFEATPGAILVGTEFALGLLTKPLPYAGVVSLDSLFAIPDFRIYEKIFSLILSLRSHVDELFIIQTRNADASVLKYAIAGNLTDFYKEEIERRKTFHYPPFTTLIKITVAAAVFQFEEKISYLEETFKEYNPDVFDAFIGVVRNKKIGRLLITLPRGRWIDERLFSLLLTLPPEYEIVIDPENIL